MWQPHSMPIFISTLLGFGFSIPSNTYIMVCYLASIRKKEKLSPSDMIFLAKTMVNILFQGFLMLQGMLYVFALEIHYTKKVYGCVNTFVNFSIFCNFWLTAWLSIHYFTIITNLSYGFVTWLKVMASNFSTQILCLTALGIFIVNAPGFWAVNAESIPQASENGTVKFMIRMRSSYSYFVPLNSLGCALPFCLSLLCFVLTLSFLLRHVWRVKSNDSGSTRPNLQAHVTALRTIFFLLCMLTLLFVPQVLLYIRFSKLIDVTHTLTLTWIFLFPAAEAAVILQASKKVKKINLKKFLTRSWRNAEP